MTQDLRNALMTACAFSKVFLESADAELQGAPAKPRRGRKTSSPQHYAIWRMSMKVSELLSKAVWHTVPKGRVERIAWVDGYLLVFYGDKQAVYVRGPNVDAGEMDKILKNPYPDSLLSKLVKKHNWKSHKVEIHANVAV